MFVCGFLAGEERSVRYWGDFEEFFYCFFVGELRRVEGFAFAEEDVHVE